MSVLIAHLSDLHLPLPDGAMRDWPRHGFKRLLTYLAWRRKRRLGVAPGALLADVAAAAPDQVAVTGDLTNLGLPAEYDAARAFLARMGPPARVAVVPGNHDATAPLPWGQGLALWSAWMEAAAPPFPYLRRAGRLALIGLSSAVPTPVGIAGGRLGAAQLAALEPLLAETGRAGLCRVLLLHHPPLPGPGGWRKALWDRGALAALLARTGAELVLHGHHHRPMRGALPGPAGPIPVLGAPRALAAGSAPAGWCLHRISPTGGGWVIETSVRTQDSARRFGEETRWTARVSNAAGS